MTDKSTFKRAKTALSIVVICWILIILTSMGSASITEDYITEKVTIANENDWGRYSEITGTYFVILDEEPYTFYIENGTITFESGIPEMYDYKIITSTSNVNKWWKIVEYYFENGDFTFKQKYLDIPWLYFNTPIQEYGTTGNIAYAVQIVEKTTINII